MSFSESSRPLKPNEYEAAQQRGFGLEQVAAAIDGIALAVNPELGMDGLTVSRADSKLALEVRRPAPDEQSQRLQKRGS